MVSLLVQKEVFFFRLEKENQKWIFPYYRSCMIPESGPNFYPFLLGKFQNVASRKPKETSIYHMKWLSWAYIHCCQIKNWIDNGNPNVFNRESNQMVRFTTTFEKSIENIIYILPINFY